MSKSISVLFFIATFSLFKGSVFAAGAIATIKGHSNSINGISWDYATVAEAKKRALAECANQAKSNGINGKCEVIVSNSGPGYLAIAHGDDGAGYAYAGNHQSAVDLAAAACQKSYKNCQTKGIKYWTDDQGPVTNVNTKTSQSNSRSVQRNVLSCTNSCMNGNCVRTFSDGRKERWQAPRVYNPSKSDWEWDTSSCGN
jgi:hypothetical protein